jgi:transposase
MARYVEALERYRGGRLRCMEAAEVLGISERHFRRLRDRYEAEGAEGLIDRRRGRASGRGPSAHGEPTRLQAYSGSHDPEESET